MDKTKEEITWKQWIESEAGKSCMENFKGKLDDNDLWYLENRLWHAFHDGGKLQYSKGFEECRSKVEEEIQIRNPDNANPESNAVRHTVLTLKSLLKSVKEL